MICVSLRHDLSYHPVLVQFFAPLLLAAFEAQQFNVVCDAKCYDLRADNENNNGEEMDA